jgi:hypothetical protein
MDNELIVVEKRGHIAASGSATQPDNSDPVSALYEWAHAFAAEGNVTAPEFFERCLEHRFPVFFHLTGSS